MSETQKQVIIIGTDDSEQSVYALRWTLDQLLAPFGSEPPFKLILLHACPTATSVIRITGPGAAEVLPYVESDLKRIGTKALENAKAMCEARHLKDVGVEMIEGDARIVLCEAVEKHGASMLVVGSHGYGAIKRAVLGSVSDYCAHHAKCTVMIVKKPKL
eukprot:TRINITY_DN2955_c0_g1_i1.p1 TRINITY_DN2955_c0_g1~~TRINITY_DN2955_c0_g1_i1.p1  ORF type:complete len:160 (+),score=3.59 TRINITY_DN2955_c0_g1_i1:92-571(+)